MLIFAPTLGIGVGHIDDGTALTIGTYGFGKYARALAFTHVEGIELTHQVTLNGGCPALVAGFLHLHAFNGFAAQTVLIDAYGYLLGIVRGKELELSFFGGIVNLLKSLCYHLFR